MSAILEAQIDGNDRGRDGIVRRVCSLTWGTTYRAWGLLLLLLLAVGNGLVLHVRDRQPLQWMSGLFSIRSLDSVPNALVQRGRGIDLQALQPALVRLQHQSVRLGRDGKPIVMIAEGSGTVVGPHTILTHGHYRPFHDPAYVLEAIIVAFQSPAMTASVDMKWVATPYADTGTTLLTLPGWMHLPEAVVLGNPDRLGAGAPVSVIFWDEVRGQFTLLETTISSVDGRVARIADPDRVLGAGNSGSGVYDTHGELVGNVWSIGMSELGRRLPWAEVALLPPDVEQYVR